VARVLAAIRPVARCASGLLCDDHRRHRQCHRALCPGPSAGRLARRRARRPHRPVARPIRLGYRTLFSLPVRSVFVVHGGVLGAVGPSAADALVDRLLTSLKSGDAEAVSIHFVDTDSEFARAALAKPGWLLRDRFLQPQRHHFLDLRSLATNFLTSLSKRERSHQRQRHKALLKDYNGAVEILCWNDVEDVDRLAGVAESIARKSYQRGIGVGFSDSREVRERLRFEARQGWLRSFVLHWGWRAACILDRLSPEPDPVERISCVRSRSRQACTS
jgi:hypothetical protein